MVEKAQQYYVFIETVEKIGISQIILKRFHYVMIENVLTFSITVWFGRASYEEKAQLETLVKCTSKIIRLTLPTIESVYHTRCMRKSKNIVRDATHPANHLFERLPSGKHYRSVKANMTRFRNSFYLEVIRIMVRLDRLPNESMKCRHTLLLYVLLFLNIVLFL